MSGITTARPAVYAALLQLVTTAVAATGTKVVDSAPHPDDRAGAQSIVWLPFADADASHRQTYTLTSLTAKSESWDADVVVFTETLGTPDAARAKFDQVLDPILAAIAGDPRLGGAAELVEVTGVNVQEAAPDRGVWQLAAVITVHVTAWLTGAVTTP